MKLPSFNRKVILTLVFLTVLLACFIGYSVYSHSPDMQSRAALSKLAVEFERDGVMSKAELFRVETIAHRVARKGNISEGDVDWLLALASREEGKDQRAKGVRMRFVAGALSVRSPSQLPASRVQNVFDFALRLIRTGDNRNSLPWYACLILEGLKNKDAIPYLAPLLSSRDPGTRTEARKAIQELNAV